MTEEEIEKMDIEFIEMAKKNPELQEPLFWDSNGINRFNEYYRMRFDNDIYTEYEPFKEWLEMTEKIEKSVGVTVTPELYEQYERHVSALPRDNEERNFCFIEWYGKYTEKAKENLNEENKVTKADQMGKSLKGRLGGKPVDISGAKDRKQEHSVPTEAPVILSDTSKKNVNITIAELQKKTR